MRPDRFGSQCSTTEKVDLVLRLLAGEAVDDLQQETGRPAKQLLAWRNRFLEGGEAYLDSRHQDQAKFEELLSAQEELTTKASELEAENRMLVRQVALLGERSSGAATTHPFCSESYARGFDEPGVELMYVAVWDTYVLVREGDAGVRQATGIRPYGSLEPSCELSSGLDALREAGVASFSVITDPMWCPQASHLRAAFDVCQPFAECHLVDHEADVHIRKRHRNRINWARRSGEVREVSLADHLERWLELYKGNFEERQVPEPYTPAYFRQLTSLEGLRTLAVIADDEIVSMSLWIAHEDTLYFHEGASSTAGKAMSAAYATYAHAIETADCRFVLLGPRAGFRDERTDGLAVFKRGFANSSVVSYVCSATLSQES